MPITITLDIPTNPNKEPSTIKVEGVKGPACMALTKCLEGMFDNPTVTLTPEHRQAAATRSVVKQGA